MGGGCHARGDGSDFPTAARLFGVTSQASGFWEFRVLGLWIPTLRGVQAEAGDRQGGGGAHAVHSLQSVSSHLTVLVLGQGREEVQWSAFSAFTTTDCAHRAIEISALSRNLSRSQSWAELDATGEAAQPGVASWKKGADWLNKSCSELL